MKTAEDIINENKRDMVCIEREKSVFEAVRRMVENRIGAILIKDGDQMVGLFSERDLLRNTAIPDFNPKNARVGDYMSTPLRSASYNTPLLKLKEMFLGLFIRHLVIEKQGRQIGMISIGDVLRASLLEQDQQIKALNAVASWEYYENWGWDRKIKKT
jgi:signal-transduction protein with cAMP-binding, CBS, and nucleotidyltransferase domain